MDKRRELLTLTRLDGLQRLQVVEAQAELADATRALVVAGAGTETQRGRVAQGEADFSAALAGNSFDPDAMRRAGSMLLASEEMLEEHMIAERKAEAAEVDARTAWHSHRLRGEALDERRRRAQRKVAQAADDKGARDFVALAMIRKAVTR